MERHVVQTEEPPQGYITLAQAARRVKRGYRWVWGVAQKGLVPTVQIGEFRDGRPKLAVSARAIKAHSDSVPRRDTESQ